MSRGLPTEPDNEGSGALYLKPSSSELQFVARIQRSVTFVSAGPCLIKKERAILTEQQGLEDVVSVP